MSILWIIPPRQKRGMLTVGEEQALRGKLVDVRGVDFTSIATDIRVTEICENRMRRSANRRK